MRPSRNPSRGASARAQRRAAGWQDSAQGIAFE
jgi:hypothetical protein